MVECQRRMNIETGAPSERDRALSFVDFHITGQIATCCDSSMSRPTVEPHFRERVVSVQSDGRLLRRGLTRSN